MIFQHLQYFLVSRPKTTGCGNIISNYLSIFEGKEAISPHNSSFSFQRTCVQKWNRFGYTCLAKTLVGRLECPLIMSLTLKTDGHQAKKTQYAPCSNYCVNEPNFSQSYLLLHFSHNKKHWRLQNFSRYNGFCYCRENVSREIIAVRMFLLVTMEHAR